MKGMIRVGAVALGLVASTAMAQAQGTTTTSGNPVAFGVFGGASVATGELKNASGTGFHVGGAAQFAVGMIPFGLRADVAYNRFGSKSDPSTGVKVTNSIIDGTLNGMFMVPMDAAGSFKPYVLAGVGVYNLRGKLDCSGSGCGEFGGDVTSTTTKFGVNGGAGVQFLMAGLSTFLEARYHYIFSAYGNTTNSIYGSGSGSNSGAGFIPISVGIMFR